jgi:hypothetical protein
MTNGELVAGLLGIIAPIVNAWFKRFNLEEKQQNAVILGFLIVVTGLVMLASGDINPKVCADLGLMECVEVVYKYLGAVIAGAFISYKMFWQALGIDDKIAGK